MKTETTSEVIKVCVSVDQKVNLGNYESAAVSVVLSNVPTGASEAEIDAALDTAKIMFSKIADRVREQVKTKRAETRGVA